MLELSNKSWLRLKILTGVDMFKPRQTTKIEPITFKMIGDVYINSGDYTAFIDRYQKSIFIPEGYPSNGANIVRDLCPTAFFLHDRGCESGKWSNGDLMCNRELSFVYYDILRYFGHNIVAFDRWVGTFFGGGGKAKENGLWSVKNANK